MGNQTSTSVEKHYQNAIHYYRKGDFVQATKSAQNAETILLQTDPESLELAKTWNTLGEVCWRQGDLDQALVYFKRSMAMLEENDPDSPLMSTTMQNMGCIFAGRYQNEEALVLLENALKLKQINEPDSLSVAFTHHNIAIVLERSPQQQEEMMYHMLKAIKIKQAKAPYSESLARSYVMYGNYCQSHTNLQFARKARDIADLLSPPRKTLNVDVYQCLALGYAKDGNTRDLDKAIDFLKKAQALELSMSPTSLKYAEINTNLAGILEEAGRLEEARAARTTALSLQMKKAPSRLEVAKKN